MFSWVFWNVTPAALRQKKSFCKTETSFYIRKHWSFFFFSFHKGTFLTLQETDTTPSESWEKELERALWKACPPVLPLKKKKNQCPALIYLFIYFWLCWVFAAAHGVSLVAASRGYSLASVLRLLTAEASLVAKHRGSAGFRVSAHGLSSRGAQA